MLHSVYQLVVNFVCTSFGGRQEGVQWYYQKCLAGGKIKRDFEGWRLKNSFKRIKSSADSEGKCGFC